MDAEIKLEIKIEELREMMYDVIKEEENLLHWKVIEVSQMLDSVLNEYNRIIN